ncbi:DUF6035 family protein [Aminobacter ciceronei]|nr:DUF6035 family protein [Aminobacter ciceronei]
MDRGMNQGSWFTRGNVTVDPLSAALAVDDPAIIELLDCDSGEFVDAKSWIGGWRYEQLIRERLEIKERQLEQPRFRCSLCSVPVYLVSNQFKRFFFRHAMEDGSCPGETRSPLTREEILARKYDGVRESAPHRRIKALIVRSLLTDPAFSGVLSERQWRSSHDPRSRRQPDVQAIGPLGRVAFEVQLSTTFLDVVAARRNFYRQEDALLVWIMGGFDPDYRRLTTDDLFFSNNSNFLVIDEETTALSENSGKFHVRCHFRRPARNGNQLVDSWESSLIPFDELTYETASQRCWHFDYDGQAEAVRAEIERDRLQCEEAASQALREGLFSFWLERAPNSRPDRDSILAWSALRRASAAHHGLALPPSPDDDSSLVALMNGLASAKEGHPVGWSFKHLIEVGHRIAEAYPHHVVAFGHAIRHFGMENLLDAQDRTGKWKARKVAIRRSLEKREPKFMPDAASLPLLVLLIPEVGEKLQSLIAKANSINAAASSEGETIK